MDRLDVAARLSRYALLLELTDDDAFRARAFANAGRMLEGQSESLETLIAENRLSAIRGIGRTVEAAIRELAAGGSFADLEAAELKVPPGIFDLLRLEGLGPQKAKTLWKVAGITSLAGLETAIESGTLVEVPGFGQKTLAKFAAGIRFLQEQSGRHLRHHALRAAEDLAGNLKQIQGVRDVVFGGSLRRGVETVRDLDTLVLIDVGSSGSVRSQILQMSGLSWTQTGGLLLKGKTASGYEVELSVAEPEDAPLRTLLMTGSKSHLRALSEHASRRGLRLDFEGFFDPSGKPIRPRDEGHVYELLGLEPVPPAMREEEAVFAAGSRSFEQPVKLKDFRGILHNHTTASDGRNTLREMAEAMVKAGYEYLGIADHSQSAAYARGLSPERIRRQWEEMDALNLDLAPFRILKGIEVDILPDGSLDYDNDLLAGFDYVVASIHSGFGMNEDAATNRLCRALENPHVDILGHPTGRLLLERNGYPVNHNAVIACAAEHGKAIELNSNPHRLDLDWRWLSRCEEEGVPVPINPDAHSIDGLWDINYGVEVAAKGPLTAANCPSTWSADRFLNWCMEHERTT